MTGSSHPGPLPSGEPGTCRRLAPRPTDARRLSPRRGRLVSLGALAGLALCACASPEPRPPVARIRLDPGFIAFGVPTAVTLDGSASRDDLDDPDARRGFTWSWDDDGAAIEEGTIHGETLRVRFTGRFATTISLTVVDEDGNAGSVFARLGLTLPE